MFVRNPALRSTAEVAPEPTTDAVRMANDGTRAVLERILDDLLRRIDEGTVGADDAAQIVRSLRAFCADPPPSSGVRSLRELRRVLDPERFASRARALAASYARLTAPRDATPAS